MRQPRDLSMVRSSLASFVRARRMDYLPNAVGHSAIQGLAAAIGAWIDGLEGEAYPVVAKARDWLRDSVDREESFGAPPVTFAARRSRALAVADWLVDNAQPAPRYAETRRLSGFVLEEMERSSTLPEGYLVEEFLPDYLLDCFSAREFLLGWTTYRRLGGGDIDNATQATGPTELAAALCRAHAVNVAGQPPGWAPAGRRVLVRVLPGWLDRGQEIRAAAWLKAVFWDCAAVATPAQALALGRDILGQDHTQRPADQ